jgi:hypothetical protein
MIAYTTLIWYEVITRPQIPLAGERWRLTANDSIHTDTDTQKKEEQ